MNNYFLENEKALCFARSMKSFMQKAINELKGNTYIDTFDYIKFQSNGKILNIGTNIQLLEYRFKYNIKYKILFEGLVKEEIFGKPHIYLWPNEPNSQIMDVLFEFGIWNGCNIFICNKNEIEVFSFSSTKGINLNNFYANEFDFLKRFIILFKSKYIQYISDKDVRYIHSDIIFPKIDKNDLDIDLPKKIYISENIYLTYKELEACKYLCKGYSNAGIGRQIYKAERTAEDRLLQVKNKLGLDSRDSIVDFFQDKSWLLDSI
jgi:DNA-binding CsgD family transcriptional regulator